MTPDQFDRLVCAVGVASVVMLAIIGLLSLLTWRRD